MVPATAKVSNVAQVQPDGRQKWNIFSQLLQMQKQQQCSHNGSDVFRTPAGDFNCIDVNQCALKSKSKTDNSVLDKLANKECELCAKYNVLYDNEASDYLDLDNDFTTVTRKRKRRFDWSSKKKSHVDSVTVLTLQKLALM